VKTEQHVRYALKTACANAGSPKAWARAKGLSWSCVYNAFYGGPLRPKLLTALGYRRVMMYEEIG
jgi:hypothetical protein